MLILTSPKTYYACVSTFVASCRFNTFFVKLNQRITTCKEIENCMLMSVQWSHEMTARSYWLEFYVD